MEKITTTTIQEIKDRGERLVLVAAYDYQTARMVDEAECDVVLVGDSLANIVLGYMDMLAVTIVGNHNVSKLFTNC